MAFRGTLRQVFEGLLVLTIQHMQGCIGVYHFIRDNLGAQHIYIYIYYDYDIILYIYLDFCFFSVSTLLERPKRNTLASSS